MRLSWRRQAKEKRKHPTFKIHVFPAGRIGNQLFQASIADQLAQEATNKGMDSIIYWHLTQRSKPDFLSGYPFCNYVLKSHPVYVRLFSNLNLNQSPIYARACYRLWRKFVVEKYELVPERYVRSETLQFSSNSVAIMHPHQEFKFIRREFLKKIVKFADERTLSSFPRLDSKGINSVAIHLRFGDF